MTIDRLQVEVADKWVHEKFHFPFVANPVLPIVGAERAAAYFNLNTLLSDIWHVCCRVDLYASDIDKCTY